MFHFSFNIKNAEVWSLLLFGSANVFTAREIPFSINVWLTWAPLWPSFVASICSNRVENLAHPCFVWRIILFQILSGKGQLVVFSFLFQYHFMLDLCFLWWLWLISSFWSEKTFQHLLSVPRVGCRKAATSVTGAETGSLFFKYACLVHIIVFAHNSVVWRISKVAFRLWRHNSQPDTQVQLPHSWEVGTCLPDDAFWRCIGRCLRRPAIYWVK